MDNLSLIIFLLAFAAIGMCDIRYGIYLVIFSMPLYLCRFSIFGIPTTVLEMMIYILFSVWILNRVHALLFCHFEPVRVRNLRMLLCKRNVYIKTALRSLNRFAHFEMTKREEALKILNIGISLLFLGLAISTLNSTDLKTSLGIFKGWFVDPFLFFIVFVSVIKKNKQIILSLKSWVFSGVVVSAISIFYLLNNELTFDGRLKAFFLSPNHLAMYLAPAFLIALFFLLNKRVFSIQYSVFSIFLIIILIPLYFTYSYGAFLGIFAGAIWLFYVVYKFCILKQYLSFPRRRESTATINNRLRSSRKMRKQTSFEAQSLLKILALVIFIAFISITVIKFNQIINSNERSSFHSRLMIWNSAGEIIKDNPVFGIGPGTFQKTYLSYAEKFDEQYFEWAVPQPHNIFLAFYLQAGLIGFVGFILILFWLFFCRDAINRVSTMSGIYIINALMIYTLIHGLVDTTYWKNDLSLMFWLIIGIKIVENFTIDKNQKVC